MAGVSKFRISGWTLIPVVVVITAMSFIPSATGIVAMTPGPIVLVIVIAVTRPDVHTAWSNLYADASGRSRLRNCRHTHEGNSKRADGKC
jgi:hypothetical protein